MSTSESPARQGATSGVEQEQKFFGSFFKKELLAFLPFHNPLPG
jgi:hypothetical protein